MIPYAKQSINESDIAAVEKAMRSEFLTTGPLIEEFEQKFAAKVGAKYAVAVSSGTAALHASMFAIGIKPGDEVIVPAITFIATANVVVYQGGTPVFADVDKDTLLIDWKDIDHKVTNKTVAVIPVDYAGQAYDIGVPIGWWVNDSCHSLRHEGHLSCHSFHAIKNMTSGGEGGMVTTDNSAAAILMKQFRNHGRNMYGQMINLGYNYRMTTMQAALGISQLDRLDQFIKRRQEIAKIYDEAFADTKVKPLAKVADHTYHLYVIRVPNRDEFREKLLKKGVGTQVHYEPVYLAPFYQKLGYSKGLCQVSEKAAKEVVSIPCYPDMSDNDIQKVIEAMDIK